LFTNIYKNEGTTLDNVYNVFLNDRHASDFYFLFKANHGFLRFSSFLHIFLTTTTFWGSKFTRNLLRIGWRSSFCLFWFRLGGEQIQIWNWASSQVKNVLQKLIELPRLLLTETLINLTVWVYSDYSSTFFIRQA